MYAKLLGITASSLFIVSSEVAVGVLLQKKDYKKAFKENGLTSLGAVVTMELSTMILGRSKRVKVPERLILFNLGATYCLANQFIKSKREGDTSFNATKKAFLESPWWWLALGVSLKNPYGLLFIGAGIYAPLHNQNSYREKLHEIEEKHQIVNRTLRLLPFKFIPDQEFEKEKVVLGDRLKTLDAEKAELLLKINNCGLCFSNIYRQGSIAYNKYKKANP